MLTEVEFSEVKPGQKFYVDDMEHVRLYEDAGDWNACEVETGTP